MAFRVGRRACHGISEGSRDARVEVRTRIDMESRSWPELNLLEASSYGFGRLCSDYFMPHASHPCWCGAGIIPSIPPGRAFRVEAIGTPRAERLVPPSAPPTPAPSTIDPI